MIYLYPDGQEIKNTFIRDEQYYICINDIYRENEIVKKFYDRIRLGSELHRLDYLLMNVIGMQRQCKGNNELYIGLGKIADIIRNKINIM